MAYQQNNRGSFSNNTRPAAPAAKGPTQGDKKSDIIFSTGMFPGRAKQDGSPSKVLGEVQLKEDLTIPAGSRLKLIPVDPSRYSDKAKAVPVYQLMVTEGQLRSNAAKK